MKTTAKADKGKGRNTAIRLPDALLARVDEYAALVSAQMPGVHVTRSDAIRVLLLRGLETDALACRVATIAPHVASGEAVAPDSPEGTLLRQVMAAFTEYASGMAALENEKGDEGSP
jgi:hypothetical protein